MTVPESGSASAIGRGNAHTSAGRRRPPSGCTGPRCALVVGSSLAMNRTLPRPAGARQKIRVPSSPHPGSPCAQACFALTVDDDEDEDEARPALATV